MRTPRIAKRVKKQARTRGRPRSLGAASCRSPHRSRNIRRYRGMALDQSFVGRTYPPTEPYEVGREKIREFAEAVGDPNPAYTDPEAAKALGHPDVIAPPTFVFAITFKAAGQVVQDPQLGLDYSRVVHGDQKFSYVRPVR